MNEDWVEIEDNFYILESNYGYKDINWKIVDARCRAAKKQADKTFLKVKRVFEDHEVDIVD